MSAVPPISRMFQARGGLPRLIAARPCTVSADQPASPAANGKQHGQPMPHQTRASAIEPGQQGEQRHHDAGNHERADDLDLPGKYFSNWNRPKKYQSGRGT